MWMWSISYNIHWHSVCFFLILLVIVSRHKVVGWLLSTINEVQNYTRLSWMVNTNISVSIHRWPYRFRKLFMYWQIALSKLKHGFRTVNLCSFQPLLQFFVAHISTSVWLCPKIWFNLIINFHGKIIRFNCKLLLLFVRTPNWSKCVLTHELGVQQRNIYKKRYTWNRSRGENRLEIIDRRTLNSTQ